MNNRKHTPGPWSTGIVFGFTEVVAPTLSVANIRGRTIPEQEANAKLIASVLDLLRELESLADYAQRVSADICDQDTGWFYQFGAATDRANAAIAKATGDEP